MKTRPNEKLPLININSSDCIIQINNDEKDDTINTVSGKNEISLLHEDVINIIASYLSYNNELANLRKTSTKMNQLVENTPAGELARKASKLQPSSFGTWITINSDLIEGSIRCISGLTGCVGGVGSGVYTGIRVYANGSDFGPSFFAGTTVSLIGGVGGFCITGLIGIGISIGVSRFSFFTQNRIREVNQIRKELEKPILEKRITL